ncbi:hypothetical protein MRS76_05600 [Rhizobiaceae bacterium n13]|uniref:Uncharacterized protein n=1 Tax=Ferirhizobium litorale TaxID=2927786 RepID=A0AAE3U2Z8_9HYPH|nr:hypothetical protein [Fererhizobium litorale]MDI7861422.1 hypothetical protein [Fererhizobium litorale]MDI7921569.1 hypothetical protein [Fererhizobium litorale]
MHARVKATVIGAVCIVAAWSLWPRFDKASMESSLGKTAADYFHGDCDLRFRAFVRRGGATIGANDAISERFQAGPMTNRIYPVLKEEEAEVIAAVERAFVWDASNVPFQIWLRANGDVTFQPITASGGHLMDGITLDECGYLIGDDDQTRQRHAGPYNEHR